MAVLDAVVKGAPVHLSDRERQCFLEISAGLAVLNQRCDRVAQGAPTARSAAGARTGRAVACFLLATTLSVLAALCGNDFAVALCLTGTLVLLVAGCLGLDGSAPPTVQGYW